MKVQIWQNYVKYTFSDNRYNPRYTYENDKDPSISKVQFAIKRQPVGKVIQKNSDT